VEALRESEALHYSLVENLRQYIFRKDAGGRFTFANGPFCRSLGKSLAEILGRTDFDFFPAKLAAKYQNDDERVLRTGEPVEDDETFCGADGEIISIHVLKTPLRDATGQIVGWQGFFWDITERKHLESRLLQAQKMDAIGQLAGGVAHDFNNILAAMMMQLGMLQMNLALDRETLTGIKEVEAGARRAADLTRQLLMFGRRSVLENKPLGLNAVVENLLKMLRRVLGERITVELHAQPDLPAVVADAGMLEQVVVNLSVNARDAMPGGGTLTIVAENCQLEGDLTCLIGTVNPGPHVVLTVADTGTGIAAELLSSIFDPFMTTKPVGQGTGIGLYTVREIVKHHCGTVQVASTPGQGTRFVLYLPAVLEANLAPQRPENQVLPCGHGELVLLVEDEATIREVSSLILQSHGYRVLGVSEGAEAITLYRERAREIDLVITDLAMPIMDGWALIRSLQQINPQVLIIALTGLEDVDLVELGTLGVRKVLTKPCSAEMMLTAMQSVLEKPVHPAPPAVGTTKRNHAAPASEFPACSPV
jgi:PAS domain S-box-containing protein